MGDQFLKDQIASWLSRIDNIDIFIDDLKAAQPSDIYDDLIYPRSINNTVENAVCMIQLEDADMILVVGRNNAFQISFQLEYTFPLSFCTLTHQNAVALRALFAFTAPTSLKNKDLTFGVGDRLGIATPGHIRVFNQHEAFPVFAQQSLRELQLTQRTFEQVVDCATFAVFREGYKNAWGADGDHLKTADSMMNALKGGCTMITADFSDHIRHEYQDMASADILEYYNRLPKQYRKKIESAYLQSSFELDSGEKIHFELDSLSKTALIYKDMVDYAKLLYSTCASIKKDIDFELSIDETSTPTTPLAHIFIAKECRNIGVDFSSLAPRFFGEFQKGIDYIGDIELFEKSFRTHASIARLLGHRISVHSGSDKFSIFPIVGAETRGSFHIKTSGTSWLCALKVIAIKAPDLFRKIYNKAVDTFETSNAAYKLTPDMNNLVPTQNLSDSELICILDQQDARRVLHIAFGAVIRDEALGHACRITLNKYLNDYYDVLEDHFDKHMDALRIKKVALKN